MISLIARTTLFRIRMQATLVALLMAIATVATGSTGSGDADSGTDAGNTRDAALLLPGYGTYQGNLTSHDRDWYRIVGSDNGPRCITLTASGANNHTFMLETTSLDGARSVSTYYTDSSAPRTLSLAVSSHFETHIYFRPSPNDPNSGDPSRPGGYTFTVSAIRTNGGADAGTGSDAGGSTGSATSVTPGCYSGRLGTQGALFDQRDTFSLGHIDAGERIAYSLGAAADAPITLRLLDEAGNAVGATVGPDGLASFTVPTSGTYYMQTSTGSMVNVGALDYLLGITVGPPEPSCNPYC